MKSILECYYVVNKYVWDGEYFVWGKWGGGGGDFGIKYMLFVCMLIDYMRLIKKWVLCFDYMVKRLKGVSWWNRLNLK